MWQFLLGLGIGASILVAYILLSNYKNIRAVIADILAFFGFVSKWVRKKSVESRYENIINGAVDNYNSSFEDKIIPNCKINWVTKDTERGFLEDDKAIICLKFDRKDQDLNFYNATYSFTKTALLPATREFIKIVSQKAIDLNLTKIFIKNYNRRALRIFNQKYKSEEQVVRDSFVRFEETEKRGLFSTILIPELHYLGENLATKTPSNIIEKEIEDFFDWFYELATRSKDERTVLNFRSAHLKVGVILVANLETYYAYGIDAYTKWAEKYASEHFGAVYLLARGKNHASIVKKVVFELVNNKGFDQTNKKTALFEIDENGEQIEISCYCLKPNLSKVQYNAWEKIKATYNNGKKINGIVSAVTESKISVNIHGIDCDIPKDKCSKKEIPDLRKYFKTEQELILNIETFDENECVVEINNIDTDTDPYILVETTLAKNQTITVEVNSVQLDREGQERGLRTYCKTINKKVFIPKKYCSYSRFIRLDSEFKKGDILSVILHGFSMSFANFFGEIQGLQNPLTNFHEYQENHKYNAIVQEITDNYITTEIVAGLECRIYHSELSWDNDKNTRDFEIGEEVELIIIKSDTKKFRLTGSLKRVQKSEKEDFFKEKVGEIFPAEVIKVYEGVGVKFKNHGNDFFGFVFARELMWGYCANIGISFPLHSEIQVTPIEFDYQTNEIIYSIKDCYKNQYDDIVDNLIIGEKYNGKILKHFTGLARVQLEINGYTIQGYIHKSEISNIAFVEETDIQRYLPIDRTFMFELKRRDNRNKVVELSRKNVVKNDFEYLDYGDVIDVEIVKTESDRAYFYEDEHEGVITEKYEGVAVGANVEVFLVSSDEFSL
jgi:ribosomal protein S1